MRKFLGLCLFLVIAGSASSQIYVQGGAGFTSKANLGGDLGLGFVAKKTTFTVGYFAMMDNDEPFMLNVQAGYRITSDWRLYGGYVRKHSSDIVKTQNSNSWIAGVEYNTKRFKKGNFYYSANYIPNYFFATIGMKFNYR